jgi:hypothetical protein
MASTLMIDDRLQIDKFNVTTFTGDYGINYDGFRKDVFIDGSYTRGIDETPTDYTDDLQFKPKDIAGNVHLKTISPNYAPHGAFPTRKFEYSDGTVTWFRPELPWSWMGAKTWRENYGTFKITKDFQSVLTTLIVLAIIAYLVSQLK